MFKILLLSCIFHFGFAVTPHPWDAVSRSLDWWMNMHKSFIETTQQQGKKIHLVFYGDSITCGWQEENGIKVWNEFYGNLSAVDYGIPADRTEHLVYRIRSGEVKGLQPKVVVVKIGTNNMDFNTPDDIAKGVKAVIDSLHHEIPNIKVLLLAILSRSGPFNAKVKQTNELIAKFNDEKSLRFLNMNSHFEDDKGVILKDLYTDGVHLTEKGYKLWAKTMDPSLKEMLKSN